MNKEVEIKVDQVHEIRKRFGAVLLADDFELIDEAIKALAWAVEHPKFFIKYEPDDRG